MSSTDGSPAAPRQRLSRDARQRQLIDTAWRLVREEGTEALTLGRVAGEAGVTKPVVYDHFGTRAGLLASLYREYDSRQKTIMDAAIEATPATLAGKAGAIAATYVDCVLGMGLEIPGVSAALAGSPELQKIKRDYVAGFMAKCRRVLDPFAAGQAIPAAGLWTVLGAAEALSAAAAAGEIAADDAKAELRDAIIAVVGRSGGA
ncbi:TetR/AcrR family transcriptional regulator [Sphingosinicella sp. LHD-64]|uniref:TetR/AcrR family transcriptional regulator n=1 Tax=Sphingosinicella sp. LHD-64 TaxID=3072139 RepID=UPI00280F8010|nr:TetR/AcrR family transcriptional regulator [Sphingosinicella sp. LHD-64]MDQ8758288.1 TetR/AcrR family transcriptional regulator [Sphingosinicella sp. LHD-64]